MRRYDDPVEVRKGWIGGSQSEGPEQFLWHGRVWKVRDVIAHWVETGPWWTTSSAQAVTGSDDVADRNTAGPNPTALDLLNEREIWRVEAGFGSPAAGDSCGVFDLAFDWSDGNWQIIGCVD
jgi:Family of unknown function (DUF6504)